MKRSNRLMILIGVFLAIVAFVGVVLVAGKPGGGGPSSTATATQVPDVTVVYAKTDIPVGTVITADMVGEKSMRPDAKTQIENNQNLYATAPEVVGKTAGSNIYKEGYVYKGQFSAAGGINRGETLNTAVAAGFRAMAVEVDQVNGVGTLLVPGDHVDIVLSIWISQVKLSQADMTGQSGKKWQVEIEGGKDVTTKLVIQNRKIITVLTKAPTEENQPAPAPNSTATPKPTDNSVHLTEDHMIVIVEVTPQEAEVIRWAQREEKADPQNYITLGLALRSKDDNDAANVNTQGVTLRVLVEKWGVIAPDPTAVLPKGLAELFKW